jgi:hypothetical protein
MTETMSGSSDALSTVFSLLKNVSMKPSKIDCHSVPSMADAYHMVNIAQGKLQELVGEYAPRIGEAKQTMIREHRP